MANKVQIITDDDAEFKCPECGEDLVPYVEEQKEDGTDPKKKRLIVIIAAVAVVLVLAAVLFFTFGGKSDGVEEIIDTIDTTEVEEPVMVDPVIDTVQVTVTDTVVVRDTVIKEKIVVEKPKTTTPSSGTLRLSYGKYSGATKGGYPHGQGKLTYSTTRQINRNDVKARTASPGDYVIGEFYNGFVVYGKHYDSAGNLIESLNFGVGSESSYESK